MSANGNETPRQQLGITDEDFQRMGEIGAMYYEQGDLKRARTIFEGLVEVDPTSAAAHAALGALYTRTQEDALALASLEQAIALDPQMIAPYVNRAEVFLRSERYEEAIADLQRAIDLDPEEQDPGANRARAIALGIHQIVQEAAEQGGESIQ
ncbi:MAG: tetratricopeptide repeat protein [Chloracidobacterium sp.]|uniref:Tetratricopeptide repeat protein n=1 Tax=Chloracidobacterium validum TaxID=2821543 RepID=A0ABX8BCG2_9BACT|nr:tetratricopeptide repeat protein [Chloracidobacterium validum]QUW04399.1 tetratricopeptide repeat protein [Chloracidobacterium validum]